jgi:riboflavin kinase/FMN adenylyltransferase
LRKTSSYDKKNAAALGLFDGVHKGHTAVFRDTVKAAEEASLVPIAVTFRGTIAAHKNARLILPEAQKIRHIKETGIKRIVTFCFDDIKSLSPEAFVKLLTEEYGVSHFVCGADFRFGINKSGGADTLKALGEKLDFGVSITPEMDENGEKISSSRIREQIVAGNINEANRLLGYDFYYNLKVVEGCKIGRSMGFPTINQIIPKALVTPLYGVYLSETLIGGKAYKSLSNIGVKPTVDYKGKPLIETYIDGFDGDLYGEKIKVSLKEFIRNERHFAGLAELKKQLEDDKQFLLPVRAASRRPQYTKTYKKR